MDVSIIIRTRDEEKNVGNCLNALTRQSKMPREIIITDNMSKDNTLKIVRSYQKILPIKILMNPVLGFASGLNLGAKKASCNYIAFLSADCVPNDDWLLNLTNFMKKNKCATVQGEEKLFPDNIIHHVLSAEQKSTQGTQQLEYFNCTNTLFDKNILKKFLPFKYVGKYLYGEDTLMSLDYKKEGYKSYLITTAFVKHSKFDSKEEFKDRVYKHSKSSVHFFFVAPLHPRIYLNSIYWVIKEFFMFVSKRDARFLKVSWWRFTATVKGTLSGLFELSLIDK